MSGPFFGPRPALRWNNGGGTSFEVDAPEFWEWINSAVQSDNLAVVAFDRNFLDAQFTPDRGSTYFPFFVDPHPQVATWQTLTVNNEKYLLVVDPSNKDAYSDKWFSPQQYAFKSFAFNGEEYFCLRLDNKGYATPCWRKYDDRPFLTFEEFVTAAVVVWGGGFVVGAVAGAGAVEAAAVGGESVVTAGATEQAAGALIASDYAGATAAGTAGVGGTAAAAEVMGPVAPAVTAGAGTEAAAGTASFSMADVMAGAKTATGVASAVNAVSKAINTAPAVQVPVTPPQPLPPAGDNTLMYAACFALLLLLPP